LIASLFLIKERETDPSEAERDPFSEEEEAAD
jgi:hypothetical protein